LKRPLDVDTNKGLTATAGAEKAVTTAPEYRMIYTDVREKDKAEIERLRKVLQMKISTSTGIQNSQKNYVTDRKKR
jgi:hypothetical protein